MGNKDFIKGMEAGAKPFEKKFQELSNSTQKISEEVNEKLDGLGAVMDVVIDDLSDMQKKELYNLNTPFDLKEDLDTDEKEILAALLLRISEYTENNEYQKKFIRSVNTYIEVKAPQAGFDISRIENIENINSQKILMQTVMEYLYLASEDFSFLDELEEEVFEHFSVNRKGIREIEGYINAVARAAGKDGIAEKYGFVPEEKIEKGKIDEETFQLYKETTPYDLLQDLSDQETNELCVMLSILAEEREPNELQNRYLEMMKSEAELDIDSAKMKGLKLDGITMDAQKIILQVSMEFGYLGNSNFDFMESEVFDEFSVNKRGIREIKNSIQKVCDSKGLEGIIEKYQYMGVDESAYYNGKKRAEKTQQGQFPEYDGSDISEACADQVNIHHHYVVLTDYLVFVDENRGDTKIYCVHKQTGEKREISVDIRDMSTVKACNICGYGKMIYLLHDSGIYSADIDSDKRKLKKMDIAFFKGNEGSHKLYAPQCNQNFLIYSRSKDILAIEISLFVLNLKSMEIKELLLTGTQAYCLHQNVIYCVDQDTNCNNVLIKYTIATEKIENIAVIEDSDIHFMQDTEYHNKSTCQYEKLVICAKNVKMSFLNQQGCYAYMDMETDKFFTKLIPDIYGSALFVSSHYIYCLQKDSSIERYDVLTEKKEKIAVTSKCIDCHEGGLLGRKFMTPTGKMKVKLQIIGKWIYYKEPVGDIIHKIIIDRKKDIILNH